MQLLTCVTAMDYIGYTWDTVIQNYIGYTAVDYIGYMWTRFQATSSKCPCLSRGVGPGDLQRSLPASAIL